MSNPISTRTWTAAIIIDGDPLVIDHTDVYDLMDDTAVAALRQAVELGVTQDDRVYINLYKTTKTHGAHVPDRSYVVVWNARRRTFAAQLGGTAMWTARNPFTTA